MDNARQIKDKPMADVLNDMLGGIDHSQPFHIVSHSDELPKELEQFKVIHTVEQVDKTKI